MFSSNHGSIFLGFRDSDDVFFGLNDVSATSGGQMATLTGDSADSMGFVIVNIALRRTNRRTNGRTDRHQFRLIPPQFGGGAQNLNRGEAGRWFRRFTGA